MRYKLIILLVTNALKDDVDETQDTTTMNIITILMYCLLEAAKSVGFCLIGQLTKRNPTDVVGCTGKGNSMCPWVG